ncbi:MAG: hypothetical protein JRC90_11450 [Deltaproteobacteria bacterium]|nr:hypothetical protein [Deltaproteobacteria bacterium]
MTKYLYNELAKRDIINMASDMLRSGHLYQRDTDGKLQADGKVAWDTPWYHVKDHVGINCQLWSHFMWRQLFKRQPKWLTESRQFLPSGCQQCFKVVVRPPTLKALFSLLELQKRLDKPSKCGIEHRLYVFGHYGGYFYTRGLEQGKRRYKEVRAAVDADPGLGPEIKVILKRACTEMEEAVGPSDKWEVFKDQMDLESLIYDSFNVDRIARSQSEMGQRYVVARWIEHAYSWGDETALEYIDPERPFCAPLVTYHHLVDEESEVKK